MSDGEHIVATPRLGIAKGIIAILLGLEGFFTMLAVAIGLMVLSAESPPDFIGSRVAGAFTTGLVILGLCLWRSIVAIRNRKVKRVTRLNFGLWLGFLVFPFWVGIYGLVLLFPAVWKLVAVVVAVVIGVYLKRKKARSSASP